MDASHPLAGQLGARELVVRNMLQGSNKGCPEIKVEINPQEAAWHADQLVETGVDFPEEFLDNGEGELNLLSRSTTMASSQTTRKKTHLHDTTIKTTKAAKPAEYTLRASAPVTKRTPPVAAQPALPPSLPTSATTAAKPAKGSTALSSAAEPAETAKLAPPGAAQPAISPSHPTSAISSSKRKRISIFFDLNLL